METVVDLGHRLGLTVVAEGVETAEALLAVSRLHCDVGQGYFISRPLSAGDMTDLLQVGRAPLFGAPLFAKYAATTSCLQDIPCAEQVTLG